MGGGGGGVHLLLGHARELPGGRGRLLDVVQQLHEGPLPLTEQELVAEGPRLPAFLGHIHPLTSLAHLHVPIKAFDRSAEGLLSPPPFPSSNLPLLPPLVDHSEVRF